LVRGGEPNANVEIHDGDVVSVSVAEVVYVVGAVTKPAGFALPDQSSGMTALQAIAMAGGMTPVAGSHNGLIIRRSADGSAQENVPIDIAKLLSGKTPDVFLKGNDVLFIPISGRKQTLHAMQEIAMSGLNGIAIYGAGYRAAGL
jgi:protein involved in polysaccharide export with SLBB domain